MTEWFCLSPRQPFKITVIQVYTPNSNAEETEVERFYEDLQELLELTTKKDVLFIIENWNAKVGSQETPGVTGKFWPGNAEWSRVKTNRVLPRKCTGHSKQQTKMDWMDEFNSDDHYIYYWGQESLRRKSSHHGQQKSLKCSTWMQSQKRQNDLCSSPRQPFKITVIQVYAPNSMLKKLKLNGFMKVYKTF